MCLLCHSSFNAKYKFIDEHCYIFKYSFTLGKYSVRLLFLSVGFLIRYGAANMAAVKPMMQQQPGGAKPNSSYNNNNGRAAAPNMQQKHSITQVGERKRKLTKCCIFLLSKFIRISSHFLSTIKHGFILKYFMYKRTI